MPPAGPAYTGKYKIVKFEGQYHGWSDEEKVSIDASCVEELGTGRTPARSSIPRDSGCPPQRT